MILSFLFISEASFLSFFSFGLWQFQSSTACTLLQANSLYPNIFRVVSSSVCSEPYQVDPWHQRRWLAGVWYIPPPPPAESGPFLLWTCPCRWRKLNFSMNKLNFPPLKWWKTNWRDIFKQIGWWEMMWQRVKRAYRSLTLFYTDTIQMSVWPGAYFSLWRTAASSLLSWTNCTLLTFPEPFVVRSRVSSCISTGTPSAVKLRSSSTPVAPFLLAWSRKRQDVSFLCKTEIYWQAEKRFFGLQCLNNRKKKWAHVKERVRHSESELLFNREEIL